MTLQSTREYSELERDHGSVWGYRGARAVLPLVLDPAAPLTGAGDYHGGPEVGWQAWGSGLLLLSAGCYEMVVTWPGGSWRTTFLAGR